MIEVFDTAAAGAALRRRVLHCPDCAGVLRSWGRARTRTVIDRDGVSRQVRPDRAYCTGCRATHVVLDAGLLPHRRYTIGVVGQALLAATRGAGHRRIAQALAVPPDTVRGWLRGARRGAHELVALGVQTVVALDPEVLPTSEASDPLSRAVDALGAAALAMARRFGLTHTDPWARINVLTRGRLLAAATSG